MQLIEQSISHHKREYLSRSGWIYNQRAEIKIFYLKTQIEKNYREERVNSLYFFGVYSELYRVFVWLKFLWSPPVPFSMDLQMYKYSIGSWLTALISRTFITARFARWDLFIITQIVVLYCWDWHAEYLPLSITAPTEIGEHSECEDIMAA